jgi:uncharacterized protein (DUF433 family)
MTVDLSKHIEFKAKRDGRMRPFVRGTRVEVLYIVTDSEVHGMAAEEIAAGYDNLTLADVYAALAFFHDNRDELRRMQREDDQLAQQWRAEQAAHSKQGSSGDARTISP